MTNSVDEKAFEKAFRCHGNSLLRGLIESYESAKQPVRVDVGACAKAAYTAMAAEMARVWEKWNMASWDKETPQCKADWINSTKAVLAVVKDAAREMGVEIICE